MLKDFRKIKDVELSTIEQYKDKLPEKIIEFWKSYGYGAFMDDFIKVVNPNDFVDYFEETISEMYKGAIVLFTTGLSDILFWHNNRLYIAMYRYGTITSIMASFNIFEVLMVDKGFQRKCLFPDMYYEGIQKYGNIEYDEAFGFVPLLPLGGIEDVDHLDKVKIREHIMINYQLIGKIHFDVDFIEVDWNNGPVNYEKLKQYR